MSEPGGRIPAELRQPAGIGPQTAIQLPIRPGLAEHYLNGFTEPGQMDPHRTGGFVSRMQDIVEDRSSGIRESHGLAGAPGWPQSGPLHVIRFYAHNPRLFNTPYGARTTEAAEARFESAAVYPEPFMGTGYTASEAHAVPEYFLPLTELPAGAELWRIDESGSAHRVGVYVHRQAGWARTDSGEPTLTPSPLRLSVRRGLFVEYGGQEYAADYGPKPGMLTLHPFPGAATPNDFENHSGIRSKVVTDVQLDSIIYCRHLCTWRGLPFEALARDESSVLLNYLGENFEHAQEIGLTEVSYRIWHAVAPRSEISDAREERRQFPIQGQFPER